MNLFKIFTFFLFFISISLFSQKNIKHTVVQGESIYVIAKKYGVTESEIYELNPKVKGAILQLKTVLLIPNKQKKTTISDEKKKKTSSKNNESKDIHTAVAGESLYVIAKKYGISLEKIKEINPSINPDEIQIGDKINIVNPKKINIDKKSKVSNEVKKPFKIITYPKIIEDSTNQVSVPVTPESIVCEDELGNTIHTVQKGETLFKITKLYNVKLKDLIELNEEVVENLPEGYLLIVKLGNLELTKKNNIAVEKSNISSIHLKNNISKADFLIGKASEHLGTKYKGGGTTSAGFDCSGLMFTTFKHIEMTLPRSSASMAVSAGYKIDRSQAQKGDLIFFTTNGRGYINHVGMIIEVLENEIKFIHSSVQVGVIISSTKEPYYSKRFVQINRVLTN